MSIRLLSRSLPRRALLQYQRRLITQEAPTGPPLPKAERNPAHKSQLPLPPRTSPAPIASTPLVTSEQHEFVPLAPEVVQVLRGEEIRGEVERPRERLEVRTPEPSVRRPVGAFGGGVLGFLLGVTLVGAYGYTKLLSQFQTSSSLLVMSVEELKATTTTMSAHIKRIERVEQDLKELAKTSAAKSELEGIRNEYRKLIDGSHLDLLDLKAHVWGVEQDLNSLAKVAGGHVRI